MQFPIEAVRKLLKMVRGEMPFDVYEVIDALAEIARFARNFVHPEAIERTETPEYGLEEALADLKRQYNKAARAFDKTKLLAKYKQETNVEAMTMSIDYTLLAFVLDQIIQWLAAKKSGQS